MTAVDKTSGLVLYVGRISFLIGILGLLVVIVGTLHPVSMLQKNCFLTGVILLFFSAVLARNTFFAILELIALVGTIIAFFPVGLFVKAGVPALLAIISIIYFAMSGKLRDYLIIIGCFGLVFLAAGFAVSNPILYAVGGVVLTVYSFIAWYYRADRLALIFTVLNMVFAISSFVNVYNYF